MSKSIPFRARVLATSVASLRARKTTYLVRDELEAHPRRVERRGLLGVANPESHVVEAKERANGGLSHTKKAEPEWLACEALDRESKTEAERTLSL